MAPRSRYRIGQTLIAPGATATTLNYNPTWCGREVCPPPPGLVSGPKVVAIHFGSPSTTTAPAPIVRLVPPMRFAAPPAATFAPSVVAPPPQGPTASGDGGGLPPPPPPGPCDCAWWKIALAAFAGWGVVTYAQKKKTPEKRRAA